MSIIFFLAINIYNDFLSFHTQKVRDKVTADSLRIKFSKVDYLITALNFSVKAGTILFKSPTIP